MALGLICAGCAYQIRSSWPTPVSRVAVPVFVDRTNQHLLGVRITRELLNRIAIRTRMKVVPEGRAAGIIRGRVESIDRHPLRRIRGVTIAERLTITVAAKFESLPDRELLAQARVTGEGSYDERDGEDSRVALERAVAEAVDDLFAALIENPAVFSRQKEEVELEP